MLSKAVPVMDTLPRQSSQQDKILPTGWNLKKKRGATRGTITMGGLHKVQKAKIRKEKQRVRRKLGERKPPVREGWEKMKGALPPSRSVIFVDNTIAGGELARRFQKAEEEAGEVTGYRIRITEQEHPWVFCCQVPTLRDHRITQGRIV